MDISQSILSDITVHMKYSKYIPELNRRESWDELVTRNKNMHKKKYPQLSEDIEKVYDFVYKKKVLPSMRSLQFGGKSIEISPNRIYNCAYLPIDDWHSFPEVMFLLLGGTGVGFSVQKHHIEKLPEVRKPNSKKHKRYLIGDSIEGWADSVKALIKSYFYGGPTINFDFSDIRPKGSALITSGGKAPGPQPLKECLIKIDGILNQKEDGDKLSPIEVHDIICHIADAVLAGGIRRAALISLFSADDEEMIAAKSGQWWELNPQRGRANNSAVLLRNKIEKEYFIELWHKIQASGAGEPGIYLSNDKDWGTNPCCFTGDTLVATADGRNAVSIKQLADEGYTGPVYSMQTQTGQVVTSYCSKVWKSRENAELIEVTLDDNSTFRCTPDHRIMLRNGQYVEAKDLIEGASLMPFNSYKRADRSYRMIQSNTGRDIAQYAHVAQYYDIIKEGYELQHIHHIDGDGTNDLPSNLEAVNAKEHNKQHMLGSNNAFFKMSADTLASWKTQLSDRTKGHHNPNSNGKTSEEMFEAGYKMTVQLGRKLTSREIAKSFGVQYISKGRLSDMGVGSVKELAEHFHSLMNHKVKSVKMLEEREDVYDMTVEGTHNFAIITSKQDEKFITSSGVFVHNCEIALRPYQFCNLCEVNVSDVKSQEDLDNRVAAAAFIGTLQAGYTNFHYLRPIWQKTTEKDALIGVGMTGIGSGVAQKYDLKKAAEIVKDVNKKIAGLIGINQSARCTTIKPSGTSSLVLGTSSGIHAWHNEYYIRNVRVGKNEAIYQYLNTYHPELVQDEYFRPHDTAVISAPQKAPEGSILRTESAIELLERVKWFYQNWIKPGHRTGQNTHNISATVSIKEDEWDEVGEWMWENRKFYNGLSVLPFSEHTYIQAPFQDITKEKYEEMMSHLSNIDLTQVVETSDNTDLKDQVACSGGACLI